MPDSTMKSKSVSPFEHSSDAPLRRLRAVTPKFYLFLGGYSLVFALGVTIFLGWLGAQMIPWSGVGINLATAADLNREFRWPWLALLIGILIGAIEGFWRRHDYRVRREAMIVEMLQSPSPLDMPKLKSMIVECIVVCSFHIAGVVLAYIFQISMLPALMGTGVSSLFFYKEYVSLYDEAKRRAAEKSL